MKYFAKYIFEPIEIKRPDSKYIWLILKFSGSPTKSAKKFSNGTSNGGGRSLILNNKKGPNETKQKQKLAKSLFFSEGEEEESEEDDDDDAEETDVFPGRI